MKKILAALFLSTTAALAQFQQQPVLLPTVIESIDPGESPQLQPVTIIAITRGPSLVRSLGNVIITWEGAIPPYKVQAVRDSAGTNWRDVTPHIYGYSAEIPNENGAAFFRVRTVPDPVPPPPLPVFEAEVLPPGFVRLEWGPLPADPVAADRPQPGATGLRGVRIFRDGRFYTEVPYPSPEFTDTNIVQGRTYTYTAAAVDHALNQSIFTAARTAVVPNYSVTLVWEDIPGADIAGYALRWGHASGIYAESIDVGNVLEYVFSIYDPYRTYYFLINAYDSLGVFGPDSNEVSYRVVFP